MGINGRAVSLLSGGIDSPVASWMIAKRGIALEMSPLLLLIPTPQEEAKQKVLHPGQAPLTPWCGRLMVHVVPLHRPFRRSLRRKNVPEELFTPSLMRRFMMHVAERVAARTKSRRPSLAGQSLGQVASQTMEAMKATGAVVFFCPILRPVVGMDKEEIVHHRSEDRYL